MTFNLTSANPGLLWQFWTELDRAYSATEATDNLLSVSHCVDYCRFCTDHTKVWTETHRAAQTSLNFILLNFYFSYSPICSTNLSTYLFTTGRVKNKLHYRHHTQVHISNMSNKKYIHPSHTKSILDTNPGCCVIVWWKMRYREVQTVWWAFMCLHSLLNPALHLICCLKPCSPIERCIELLLRVWGWWDKFFGWGWWSSQQQMGKMGQHSLRTSLMAAVVLCKGDLACAGLVA